MKNLKNRSSRISMKPCNTARNIGSRKNCIAPFESVCSENTAFVAMSKSVRSYFKNYEFIVSKENKPSDTCQKT